MKSLANGGRMFVVLEDRESIAKAIVDCCEREGVAAVAVGSAEFESWFENFKGAEASAVEAILLGSVPDRTRVPSFVQRRCGVPIIAIQDGKALNETLQLFAAGVNDVVVKPFHVREILARVGAARRRILNVSESVEIEGIKVYFDGQDPEINGVPLALPRRERRILEYLVLSRNLRVTKTQIFNRVYGVCNERIHENVVESHISRLRKRLKQRLGFDPIESQRYLGYRFVCLETAPVTGREAWHPSLTQGHYGPLLGDLTSEEEQADGSLRSDDYQRVRDVCAS